MVLRRVHRRRNAGNEDAPEVQGGGVPGQGSKRDARDPAGEAEKEDGERKRGGAEGDGEMDEDDPNAGQFVNYQVGMEYLRTPTNEGRGWGLGCLVSPHYSAMWKETGRGQRNSDVG